MQIENTRWYRVRDVAGHCAVSVATIYRVIESGQLAAVTFGRGTGVFWVSGAAVLADERACAQAVGELLRSTMRGRWWWRHEAGGSGGVHGGAAVPALLAGGVSVVGAHCRCCGAHGIGPPGGDGRFECQVAPGGCLVTGGAGVPGYCGHAGVFHGVGTAQLPGPRQGGRCQAGSERSVEHGTRPARQLAGGGEVR
jgi:hypothetical protein